MRAARQPSLGTMPKLYINIHVDKDGNQTLNVDGDPSLWPLVGRLAAAATASSPPSLAITNNCGNDGHLAAALDEIAILQDRLARCAAEDEALRARDKMELQAQLAELPWFTDLWSRTAERPVKIGESLLGRRFYVLDEEDPRIVGGSSDLFGKALLTIGWSGKGDVLAWAASMRDTLAGAAQVAELMQPRIVRLNERDSDAPPLSLVEAVRGLLADQDIAADHEAQLKAIADAMEPLRKDLSLTTSSIPEALKIVHREYMDRMASIGAFDSQADIVDEILRPVLSADDGDNIEQLASIARVEIEQLEKRDQTVRGLLEEAIGRTPDPSRSTEQLARDLAVLQRLRSAALTNDREHTSVLVMPEGMDTEALFRLALEVEPLRHSVAIEARSYCRELRGERFVRIGVRRPAEASDTASKPADGGAPPV